jgi:hypothetical protein
MSVVIMAPSQEYKCLQCKYFFSYPDVLSDVISKIVSLGNVNMILERLVEKYNRIRIGVSSKLKAVEITYGVNPTNFLFNTKDIAENKLTVEQKLRLLLTMINNSDKNEMLDELSRKYHVDQDLDKYIESMEKMKYLSTLATTGQVIKGISDGVFKSSEIKVSEIYHRSIPINSFDVYYTISQALGDTSKIVSALNTKAVYKGTLGSIDKENYDMVFYVAKNVAFSRWGSEEEKRLSSNELKEIKASLLERNSSQDQLIFALMERLLT